MHGRHRPDHQPRLCRSSPPTRSGCCARPCARSAPTSVRSTRAARRPREQPPTELWDALASRGFLSVNLPEEYGGGGLGMSALAAVGEEITASGCSLLLIVVSPAIVGSILVRHGNAGAEGRLAARDRGRHDEGGLRDHGAGRRLELAQPLHLGAPVQRQLPAPGREDLHLRRRGLRRDPGGDPRARRRRQPRAAAAVHRRLRRTGPRQTAHPDSPECARQAVDPATSTTSRSPRTA